MTIETIETQKIVDRLIKILGKNINIMNKDGIIIASGDKTRIGDFHGAAKDAIEKREEIIVHEENKKEYEGSKSGVNIPIYYKGEVLGVVGITGDPAEVEGYGLILKELVELMIQEEERRSFELFQSRAIKSFAREVIKYNGEEDYKVLRSRAKLVQFNAEIPRMVIALDVCGFSSIIASYKKDADVLVERLKQQIVDCIYGISNSSLDVVVNVAQEHFAIFKSNYSDLSDYYKRIEQVLYENLKIKAFIGVGGICTCLEDYHPAYELATNTVSIGQKLYPDKLLHFCKDYKLELLVHNLRREQKEQFLSSMGGLFQDKQDESSKEVLNTVKSYFENRMSIKDTANALYVHRNTILYRINKFIETYKIDVTNPYQCMMVYIALKLTE